MKTTAIVFEEPGRAEFREVEIPEPGPGDIVVETCVSGVSVGTERWAFLGRRPELKFPHVPGYLGIGTISSAGALARELGWLPGQTVNFFRSRFCDPPPENGWMGAHARRAVVDVSGDREQDAGGLRIHWCEKVPEGAEEEAVVLCGLAAVAMRGIEMAVVPAEARVLVAGLGVIGQSAAQLCASKGAEVWAMDRDARRVALAEKLAQARPVPSLEQLPDAGPFDVIIDTTSSAEVVNALFPHLRCRGKFVFQGWYPPPTPLDLDRLHQKLPSCFFPCAHTGAAVACAMRMAVAGRLALRELIDERIRPEEAPSFYRKLGEAGSEILGAIVEWRDQ